MPLHWNVEECAADVKSETEWPVLHVLIFQTMPVGISAITQETYQEFARRLAVIQFIHGALLADGNGNSVYITEAMVKARIGLRTNASPISKAAFAKRCMEIIERKAVALINE